MSKSPTSRLLKPVIAKLVTILPIPEDHKDPLASTAQFCHAALGSISPEKAGEHKLPIEKYPPYFDWCPEYDFISTSRRISRLLGLPQQQSDDAAQLVISELGSNRIGLNKAQLFLDPTFENIRDAHLGFLLKGLPFEEGRYKPTTATMAIASKVIPKPDTSWASRLGLMSKQPSTHFNGNVLEIVARSKCYVWSFPPAKLSETTTASMDIFDGWVGSGGEYDRNRASLGMGFVIIAEPWGSKDPATGKAHDQYNFYVPHWLYDERYAKLRPDSDGWRVGNILDKSIYEGWPNGTKLKWHLHGGIRSLPQIKSCLKCSSLYIERANALPGMPVTCKCHVAAMVAAKAAASTAYDMGYRAGLNASDGSAI
ncbi:hypothetical protein [Halomonas sp. KO116]|uniref:hypothetical protein n=1 Tax=Halomonas sp. KO116 TaxID=1504981 RepID=UPI0004E2F5F4|nr:hypothetical protein [Halomonas sp. KO116]AJY53209.1 hypothetical protein KO116_P200102 [Halomonas sp. KO116]